MRISLQDGTERIVYSQARVTTGDSDECLALEGFTQDITELRNTEEQVRFLEVTLPAEIAEVDYQGAQRG